MTLQQHSFSTQNKVTWTSDSLNIYAAYEYSKYLLGGIRFFHSRITVRVGTREYQSDPVFGADNGEDYSMVDGTSYFSDGEMSQTIVIDIFDNNTDENTETFNLSL